MSTPERKLASPSPGFEVLKITPELMSQLWRRFYRRRHLFANGLGVDVFSFVDIMGAQDTVIYGIGHLDGLAFFTGVLPEPEAYPRMDSTAKAHVYLWHPSLLGRPEIGREVARDFVQRFRVHRLIAEVPVWNPRAARYAQKVGFKSVGRLRRRTFRHGKWHDALVLDAIPEDLGLMIVKEERDGRYWGLRAEERGQEG